MKFSTQKTYLTIAGTLLVVIGAYIAMTPGQYLAGFIPGQQAQADFLSELRGMGGNLLVFGLFALLAVRFSQLVATALTTSTLVYGSFAGFRLIGILLDGVPGTGVLIALTIELLFAGLGLLSLCVFHSQQAPGQVA